MNPFGWTTEELETLGARWTAHEIAQQPQVWVQVQALAGAPATAPRQFLARLLAQRELRIVLTGAGSSAYVGQCLAPALQRQSGRWVEAIATTDLVAAPRHHLLAPVPTLLVSFARSGNSPESVAALELAQALLPRCHHFVITCNAQGELGRRAAALPNACVLQLPDAVNDRSFAMTSSFSSMLLAAALAFDLLPAGAAAAAARQAQQVLERWLPRIRALAAQDYERVIFLGAKELKALAREAALKLLELTDGAVVALSDTPLGFRHGPKTIVNARTLVVLLLSSDPTSRRYDLDLLKELRSDGVAGRVLALRGAPDAGAAADPLADPQDELVLADAAADGDLALCLPYLVFAQCLALLRSIGLGRRPDSPNAAGTVNRVVRGVTIYPLDTPA
jgi:tagatose-6-phosphate ketose/aldose isomerase